MLQKKNRFHGYGSLRFVYSKGKVARSSLFIVKYTTNPRRKHSRFAVVVSKKVLKSAVGRNRIRRRVYEVVRREQPQLIDAIDVAIIVISAEVLSIDYDNLRGTIKTVFSKAGLYK